MIDTHCHLTFEQLSGQIESVLDRAVSAGVERVITVSVSAANAAASLALAEAHDRVWCTSGVHPLYADQPTDWNEIRRVAGHPRCVAWGELGLDHHYDRPPRDLQERILLEQLDLITSAKSEGLELPVVVHCRKAVPALLPILRDSGLPADRFVFHCFTESPDDARAVLDFGAWISFTGVVTFKGAPEVRASAALVPEDRLMVETDAPYLAPEPHRKVFPNEPAHVVHVARRLAEVRGVDPDDLERTLDANAHRFFGFEVRADRTAR